MAKLRSVIKSVIKRLLLPTGIAIGLAALPVAGALTFLLTPRGNEWLRAHLESYLSRKLHTTVSIGRIHLRNPYHLAISDFSLLDQTGRVLVSFKTLSIELQWAYWCKSERTFLDDLRIERLTGTIERESEEQHFNYQFLLDALNGSEKGTDAPEPDLEWLTPGLVDIRGLALTYRDAPARDSAVVSFAALKTSILWSHSGLLTIRDLLLSNALFHRSDEAKQLAVHTSVARVHARNGAFRFQHNEFHIGRLVINDHFTTLRSGTHEEKGQDTDRPVPFKLDIDTLLVSKNRFSIDLKHIKKTSRKEFDAFHNDFQNIGITASGIHYRAGALAGRLAQLTFVDAQKFRLYSLGTTFQIDDKAARLDELNLLSERNAIRGRIAWCYPSIEKALSEPGRTRFTAAIKSSRLNLKEVAYFLPVLLRYHDIYPLYKQNIRINAEIDGSPRNIRLGRFDISTAHNLAMGSGEIHIPQQGDTWLLLDVRKGLSGKKGLLDVVSKSVLSAALLESLPEKVRLNGKLRITTNALRGSIAFASNLGTIRLKGSLNNFDDLNRIRYNLAFDGRRFDLGKVLNDTLWGAVTARGQVQGTGLRDANQIALRSTGYSEQLRVAGRSFQAVLFEAQLADGWLKGNLASSHPDLNFELSPTLYLSRPDSLASIYGWVNHADLHKLGLLKDSVSVGGWISAEIDRLSPDTLIGNLKISSAHARYKGKDIDLNELTLNAAHPGDQQVLRLHSALADVDLSGQFALDKIPALGTGLLRSLTANADFPAADGVASFQMQGHVHLPSEVLALTPGVSRLAPFSFTSDYAQNRGIFEVQTTIDSLTVDGIEVDSGFVHVRARRNDLTSSPDTDYLIGAKKISGNSVALPHTQVSGRVRTGLHTGELLSSENSPGSLLRIPFQYNGLQQNPFIILGDSLYLKEELWKVNRDNAIYPFAPHLAGSKLALANGARSAAFTASGPETQGLPYQLQLSDISLGPLFALMKADSTLLTGSVSGTASVNQLEPLAITARAHVDDLKLKGAPLGKLEAEIKSESAERYTVAMDIRNDRPVLNANGTYEPRTGTGNVSIDIRSFPIAPLSTLLGSAVDSLQGAFSGHLVVKSDTNQIAVNGLVKIDSSTFDIRETGSRIQVVAGGFAFAGEQVNLEPLQLRDGAGGQATITGSVNVPTDHRSIHYKLKMDAKRFKTIGELRRREQLVYGNGKTDATLELSGNLDQYKLAGQVSLNDSSQIFYRSAAISRPDFGEGLLEFTIPNQSRQQATPATGSMSRLVNTNISVPSNATLTLLLDEYRGEKAVVQGKSNLNYSQHAGGEMQLNGKYEVTSGTYTFSVGNNIRKEFTLENGGTIQWMGNIYEPLCDLTAVYKVNTSAGALMQGTDADAEAGRRKFDFLVKLKLKGNLAKPDITFEIGMNETDQDAFDGAVYSKIRQINNSQSDATKQVMSLLVLNSFVGDSPFGSLSQFSSTAMEAGAYNTIGNLLTRQLNNMLAGMVKAVDITLGVNWSESVDGGRSSTRSDIKLGLGKSLFNHRLNLYVGNNFGVETLSGNNSGISGLANDVSVEYLLDPEGKYRIKGYHVRDNELTLHGEHMETGVRFTITWEFNQPEGKRAHQKTAR